MGKAIDTLHGGGPGDFRKHCLTVGRMVLLAGSVPQTGQRVSSLEEAQDSLVGALDDGFVWHKFVEWITDQGGDRFEEGEPLLTIHASDGGSLAKACQRLLSAISWSHQPVTLPPHIRRIIN